MAASAAQNIPVGWCRWESQLKDVEDKCLSFTEDTCREVAKYYGFKAVNIRWEPHNWSGNPEDKIAHDWHITADFQTLDNFAKTAHIYCSSGSPDWFAIKRFDGSIKAVFQDDINADKMRKGDKGRGRSASMPPERSSTKAFVLARVRQQPRARSVSINTAPTWRSQTPSASTRETSKRNTWSAGDKPRRDVRELASWR